MALISESVGGDVHYQRQDQLSWLASNKGGHGLALSWMFSSWFSVSIKADIRESRISLPCQKASYGCVGSHVDSRRRHGVSLARADRDDAKQRPGRAHGQRDHQPAIDHSRSRARASNCQSGSDLRPVHVAAPRAAPFVRQVGAALGVSAFVRAATVGGFRTGLLVMIAVSAGTFACILALPTHSLHEARQVDVK